MDWLYVYFIGGFVAVAVIATFGDRPNVRTYDDLLREICATAIVFALSWFALLVFSYCEMRDARIFDKEVFWRK